ncbi:MAG: lysophospholipid acyltransferase family protein [Gemmatimonadetes bacterium]|nr:lysophospholipid acyltransferase family protein [Gemmatimonadota bacterium]
MASTKTPTLAHRAQYVALRALIGTLRLAGWRTAGAIGGAIGRLGYSPLGIRRALVEEHLRRCFPEFDEARVREVARASYAHLARVTLEAALLAGDGAQAVFDRFEPCTDWPVVEAALAEGKGVCMVTGHFGNWELAGSYVGARPKAMGSGLEAIVRAQSNPLFENYINRTREELGMIVVPDAEAVRRTPRALKNGLAVAFVMDQGVIGLASTFVPFFGRLAKTPRGPAVFALRFQSPVVFAAAIRQPSGKYKLTLERVPVQPTGDREYDVDMIVAAYTATLERFVRATPEQYFWQHRRWKHAQPEGTSWPPARTVVAAAD